MNDVYEKEETSSDDEEEETAVCDDIDDAEKKKHQISSSVIDIPTATSKSMKRKRIRYVLCWVIVSIGFSEVINDESLNDLARDARQKEIERLQRLKTSRPLTSSTQQDELIDSVPQQQLPVDNDRNIEVIELSDDDDNGDLACSSTASN